MTNDYNESPEVIKTDIERTRQNMSEKIDQIQARLSPTNIKAQAQETMRDIVRDSTESLTTYLSENSKELGATVAQAIKNNPIPAALIGIGIGWLLVESVGGSHSNQGYSRRRHEWQNDNWYSDADSRYAASTASGLYASREMTPSFASQYREAGSQYQGAGSPYYGSQYGSAQGQSGGYTSYTSSDQPGWVREQASSLREQIGEKAEQLRDTVQQVGEQVSEKVGEWTDSMRSQSSAAGEQANYYTDQARGQMANLGEQASYMGQQAQMYARQTGQQLQRSLEDNPLVFGGVALAVGALIGMALPVTRRENEMLGPWRDEVVHSMQEVASDVAERAQHVVEEVRPQLEQTAQKVVSDLKQSGQSALEEVKQSGREALQEVKESGRTALDETKREGKEAVEHAQQKMEQSADNAKREANKVS